MKLAWTTRRRLVLHVGYARPHDGPRRRDKKRSLTWSTSSTKLLIMVYIANLGPRITISPIVNLIRISHHTLASVSVFGSFGGSVEYILPQSILTTMVLIGGDVGVRHHGDEKTTTY